MADKLKWFLHSQEIEVKSWESCCCCCCCPCQYHCFIAHRILTIEKIVEKIQKSKDSTKNHWDTGCEDSSKSLKTITDYSHIPNKSLMMRQMDRTAGESTQKEDILLCLPALRKWETECSQDRIETKPRSLQIKVSCSCRAHEEPGKCQLWKMDRKF